MFETVHDGLTGNILSLNRDDVPKSRPMLILPRALYCIMHNDQLMPSLMFKSYSDDKKYTQTIRQYLGSTKSTLGSFQV